ncbi:hypothetical protein EV190_101897 [Actinorugispora endophytica]|uniref:Uncharacterized protein n=1 Tax=Actinorugispora endophytica TaxID=1605990 RepID=A0A4R6V548_9ACTN|nr:hypothetical protein EV190_101897 [Actinorugispora endophytica]
MTGNDRTFRSLRRLPQHALPDPTAPVLDRPEQFRADQPLQPPRGGQPVPAFGTLAQMRADHVRRVPGLLPVEFGGESCSTVDAPHPSIIADTAAVPANQGVRRVGRRGADHG